MTHRRDALSLLEVLVALAIFLFSLVALGTLVSMGGDRADEVRQQGWAVQRCQSKLAEVLAGAVPLGSQQGSFDEDPDWQWTVEAETGPVTGLWNVTVRVTRKRPGGSRIEVSLSQMVLDPSIRGTTASSSSAGGGSSGGTGSSSGGSTGGR
jgi:type II secretory pathway pseudopilin PulG